MFFFQQFQEFNPVLDYVWETPFNCMPVIADRARDLLKSRSLEQILVIAKSVGHMIDEHFEDIKIVAIYELKDKLEQDVNDKEFHRFFEWDGGTRANGRWDFKEEMVEELDILTAENSSVVDALKSKIEDWDDEEPDEDGLLRH